MKIRDEDRKLLWWAKRGVKGAFEKLVERHYVRIYRFVVRFVGEETAAEDLTQEVFINAHKHLKNFRGECKFVNWLYRIAGNRSLNHLRDAKRQGKHLSFSLDSPIETDSGAVYTQAVSSAQTPEEKAMEQNFYHHLRQAICCVSEHFREALILRDLEELTYDEIARTLEVSVGTAKSRVHRGRMELKKLLEAYLDSSSAGAS